MLQEMESKLIIRSLEENDLAESDRLMRLAFGTYLRLPEPSSFLGEGDYVYSRWRANRPGAFGAVVENKVVGSAFVTNWGSVGFLGPLTVDPDYWDKGIASALMRPVIEYFDDIGTSVAGLFTFSGSSKHLGLYQKFGFWPHYLTAIMSRPVITSNSVIEFNRFSQLNEAEREDHLKFINKLTDSVFPGLSLSAEIRAVAAQKLGDTIFLWDRNDLAAMAVCHYGRGTEASAGACYVKFGVVKNGKNQPKMFNALVAAVDKLATELGLSRIVAGMNTARHEAYKEMLKLGFRAGTIGIIMQRPNRKGYNRKDNFIIDDWR